MLVPASFEDEKYFYLLYMHPQINPYLLYEIMEEDSFKRIYIDLLHQHVLYKYTIDDKPVGMCKLISLQHRNSHIFYLGGLAIHPDEAGKQYGFKMLQEIISFAKENSKSRIELSVSTENKKAIALYKKAGFEQEGIMRNFTFLKSENRFLDEALMSYIFTR